jgi:DNA-binding transcriptional LysR family regulator
MELRELRYFAAVFEEKNLTAAARRSFVSQPSISAAIAQLEHELATTLFLRHKRGVAPTAAAQQLYPVARRMVDEAAALRGLFRKPEPERRLTLGLMRALDVRRISAMLKHLASDRELQLTLVAADSPCDARVVSRIMLQKGESFVTLWRERYVVVLPPGHALAMRASLRIADLDGARLIARCHCEYHELLARSGARFETAAIAPSEEWALALAAAGVGIAVVPEGVVREGEGVVVRPLRDIDLTREVGLAYGAQGPASTELRRLMESLQPSQPKRRARKPAPARTRRPRAAAR